MTNRYKYPKEEIYEWIQRNAPFLDLNKPVRSVPSFTYVLIDVPLLRMANPAHPRGRLEDPRKNLEKSGYACCGQCKKIYVDEGGHLKRHAEERCLSVPVEREKEKEELIKIKKSRREQLSMSQMLNLTSILGQYFRETNLPLEDIYSPAFKSFIAHVLRIGDSKLSAEAVLAQLPTTSGIQSEIENASVTDNFKTQLFTEVDSQEGPIAIIADPGGLVPGSLSLYASFAKENKENKEWSNQVIPVTSIPYDVNDLEQILNSNIMKEVLRQHGFTEHRLAKCRIVVNGNIVSKRESDPNCVFFDTTQVQKAVGFLQQQQTSNEPALPESDVNEARDLVLQMMSDFNSSTQPETSNGPPAKKVKIEPPEDDETSRESSEDKGKSAEELQRYQTVRHEPTALIEEHWISMKSEFPGLYKVAKFVYGIVPMEPEITEDVKSDNNTTLMSMLDSILMNTE